MSINIAAIKTVVAIFLRRAINVWQECLNEKIQHCQLLEAGMTSRVHDVRQALGNKCPEPVKLSTAPTPEVVPSTVDPAVVDPGATKDDDDKDSDTAGTCYSQS